MKLPLLHGSNIHTLEGTLGTFRCITIGRMPDYRTLLSLDESLAIPRRVLRFKASRRPRAKRVRPVSIIDQTRFGPSAAPSLRVVAQSSNPAVLW
jgi:hypothetical protein